MASHIYPYFLSIIIFTTLGFPLNLTLTDYHDPAANHMLDAEVVGDILIVSALIQGIELYDISNPEILNHLTSFSLSGGGGGGGPPFRSAGPQRRRPGGDLAKWPAVGPAVAAGTSRPRQHPRGPYADNWPARIRPGAQRRRRSQLPHRRRPRPPVPGCRTPALNTASLPLARLPFLRPVPALLRDRQVDR